MSRFISAGAIDPSTGEAAAEQPSATPSNQHDGPSNTSKPPNEEWLAVEKELAAERRRREEHRAATAASGERSLFEVLEANKAAKQAAFEEANKIKNQFRALDDDEIDFLDEVKAKERAEDERLRRETEEGLEAFRAKQRGERVGEATEETADADVGDEWAASAGRKRKREKEKKGLLGGVVKRRTASEGDAKAKKEDEKDARKEKEKENEKILAAEKPKPAPAVAVKPKLGLVSYDSDDSDD